MNQSKDNIKKETVEFGSLLISNIQCSNDCIFCRMRSSTDKPNDLLKKDEIKLYKDVVFFVKNNIKNIEISGTEPLKYSKIIPFLKWIRKYFNKITILDPGNSLHNEEFTKKLIETNFDKIIIPIYGSKAEIHNTCVQNPKAYNQLIQGLDLLFKYKKPDQIVELTTIILKPNQEDIINLIKYLKQRYNIKYLKINNFFAKKHLIKYYDEIAVNFKKIREIIIEIAKRFKDIEFNLEYIPLCLFNEQDIRIINKAKIRFFNSFYLYYLSKDNYNKKILDDIKDYRKLIYHKKCDECYLNKKKICHGIIYQHYHHNKDFNFKPINKDSFELIKNNIIYSVINPKKDFTEIN